MQKKKNENFMQCNIVDIHTRGGWEVDLCDAYTRCVGFFNYKHLKFAPLATSAEDT